MQKIESYLVNLDIPYEDLGDNTWIINDQNSGLEQVAVAVNEPLVVVRVKVMELPRRNREEFMLTLLKLNGSDLVHGAYAIVDNDVILIDTLNYETMHQEDFQATLDAVSMALTEHYSLLTGFRE
ncbi:MAG: YbjN domain-containing protein [Sediminispirochaetaceae bacterium]